MTLATRKRVSIVLASALGLSGFSTASLAAPQSPAQTQSQSTQSSAPEPTSRAARGTTGAFELNYEPAPLRAKATSDLTAPILVRVSTLAPSRYRIEYMGLVSGSYDLCLLYTSDAADE